MERQRDVTTDIVVIAERVRRSSCVLFDCDGVILNSNAIKTQSFYDVAKPFGEDAARDLIVYHQRHGGISRFEKFRYLAERLAVLDHDGSWVRKRCDEFAEIVYERLLSCEMTTGLMALREANPDQKWFIVSGGKEDELRRVFEKRGIADLFDGGIHGSPRDKYTILSAVSAEHDLQGGIFLGDTRYDWEVARRFGLSFVFVSDWTEVDDWKSLCRYAQVDSVPDIDSIARLLP